MSNPLRSLLAKGLSILVLLAGGLQGVNSQEPGSSATPATAGVAVAELVLLNDSGRTLFAQNQVVTDNGKPLASLPRQTYVRLSLAPGRHVLRPEPYLWKQEVTLEAVAGNRYFVVIAYRPERSWALPFAGTPLLLQQLGEADAQALLADMHPFVP